MSELQGTPGELVEALARVQAKLSAAETALAAGTEIPLDDLEACVDLLCQASARVDPAIRGSARGVLQGLLIRLDAIEAAIAAKAAP